MPVDARIAVLPSPVTFHATPNLGAATRYGNLKYVPSFPPEMPSVEIPLVIVPVPGTMLPARAGERNTVGLAGSMDRWLAAEQGWFPATPGVAQVRRYTRPAWLACQSSAKKPVWLLLTSKSDPLCWKRTP